MLTRETLFQFDFQERSDVMGCRVLAKWQRTDLPVEEPPIHCFHGMNYWNTVCNATMSQCYKSFQAKVTDATFGRPDSKIRMKINTEEQIIVT